MEFLQFVEAVEGAVKARLPKDVSVEKQTVMKNNGKERTGITISEKEYNLSPTIYLEEFYERFSEQEEGMEEIVEQVLCVYQKVRIEKQWDVAMFTDYEKICSSIVYKVIHAGRNKKLLQGVPHGSYLDLALVCYVRTEFEDIGTATILVTRPMLKLWNISVEKLFCDAARNTEAQLEAEFVTMEDMLVSLGGPSFAPPHEKKMLYVLTNKVREFGAVCMLYKGVLEKIALELKESFFVIPSSVHEVLIVPESAGFDRNNLEEMLHDVNETMIPEEILSDNVYYYQKSKKRLIL